LLLIVNIGLVSAQDTTPPQVNGSSPTGNGIQVTAHVEINFDEAMNETETEKSFSISPSVTGDLSWRGPMLFTPSSNLAYDTTYTVTINADIARDVEGNFLDGNCNGVADGSPADDFVMQFTTVPQTVPPRVASHAPFGTNVPTTSLITVEFDKLMNHTAVENSFSLSPPASGIFDFVDVGITTMTYTLDSPLAYSTMYTVLLRGNMANDTDEIFLDGNGNGIAEGSPLDDFIFNFTTDGPDDTPPQVIDNTPVSSSASITSHITVIFDEKMNETATKQAFNITPFVPGVFQIDDDPGEWLLAFHPSDNLQLSTAYTVTVNSDTAMDTAGRFHLELHHRKRRFDAPNGRGLLSCRLHNHDRCRD